MVKNLPAMWETWVQSLGWENPLEEGLQYSCLENLMDRGAWQATVHRVTQSQIQLKRLSTTHTRITESLCCTEEINRTIVVNPLYFDIF